MSRVQRSSWADAVHASGVVGLQEAIAGTTLTAQLDSINARLAALESAGSGSTTSGLIAETRDFEWVIGTLEPMQSANSTFSWPGLAQGSKIFAYPLSNPMWLGITAYTQSTGSVWALAYNLGPVALALGTLKFRVVNITNG